jgi:hypothetical protein
LTFAKEARSGRIEVLEVVVLQHHLGGLAVEVQRVHIDTLVCCRCCAPHRRIKGQQRLDELERGILEGLDRHFVRKPVELQQQSADVTRRGAGHRQSLAGRPGCGIPYFHDSLADDMCIDAR